MSQSYSQFTLTVRAPSGSDVSGQASRQHDFLKGETVMIARILRFSWLAATLLVSLALWSQTSQTPQTTTLGESAAVGQTANFAQPTASAQETAGPDLRDDLNIHLTDRFTSQAVEATAGITCKQRCLNILDACLRAGEGTRVCDPIYNSCVKKC